MSTEMASKPDLWGDIDLAADRTPVVILREQAALLGKKTKNVVEAKVTTAVSGKSVHHSFNLVVPAMDGYTYELFSIRHGVEAYYPVTVDEVNTFGAIVSTQLGLGPIKRELADEAQFTAWLQEQLSSPKTKKIVGTLFSQVAA